MGREDFEKVLDDFKQGGENEHSEKLSHNIDAIDEIFLELVEKEEREENEQFLTPEPIAHLMADWVIEDGPGSLLDPAVGTGVFLSKAVEASENVEIHGRDIDELMLEASKVRLNSKGFEPKLQEKDFLEDNPFSGVNEEFDYFLCNPPYKKFKEYENSGKIEWIKNRYGVDLDRQSNLFSAFIVHSKSMLTEGGRAGFITPNEFIYSNYGEEVKKFLLNRVNLHSMVMLDYEGVFGDDILTTPVITFYTNDKAKGEVEFIHVDEPIEKQMSFSEIKSEYGFNEVKQEKLEPKDKWLAHFLPEVSIKTESLVPLEKFASSKRGVATGHNDYFLFTRDEIKDEGLSKEYFVRVLSKSSYCKSLSFTEDDLEILDDENKPTYLLYNVSEPEDDLNNYLEKGKKQKVDERYLAKNRNPWYEVERRDSAQILATTFSRGDMRFIYNDADVLNLTAFHGIYTELRDDENKALLAYLNSGIFSELLKLEMRVHGGLNKLEPNDLEELPVLDIPNTSEESIRKLSSLFDELERARRNNNNPEEATEKIDEVIQKSF